MILDIFFCFQKRKLRKVLAKLWRHNVLENKNLRLNFLR